MRHLDLVRNLAIAGALAIGSAAAAQPAPPPVPIEFHGGSVAFIAGVHWGGGSFRWDGHKEDIRVNGLKIGAIGAEKFEAVGEVKNLKNPEDIEGVYAEMNTAATAGKGTGKLDLQNDKGVEIHVQARTKGLNLSLAPGGVEIHLAHEK